MPGNRTQSEGTDSLPVQVTSKNFSFTFTAALEWAIRVVIRISTGSLSSSDRLYAYSIMSYASCCDEGSRTGIIANLP